MTSREDAGEWDADSYDADCAFVFEYGEGVTDLLDISHGTRVLDLGCGTGQLSRQLHRDGATVVGVDQSAEMIERARSEHDVEGLRFVHGDARQLLDVLGADAAESFDAVFSNAALHWIPGDDHDDVLGGVARLLAPGGAFVAELGGRGNVERIVDAVRTELRRRGYAVETPWYFPSVGEYAPRLESHGLEVRHAQLFDRPTELDGGDEGLRTWLAMFGDGLLAPVPEAEMQAVVSAVEAHLRDNLYDDGTWVADYRRLRFRAVKSPASTPTH
jgi:SAM-dependent methyltransferase